MACSQHNQTYEIMRRDGRRITQQADPGKHSGRHALKARADIRWVLPE